MTCVMISAELGEASDLLHYRQRNGRMRRREKEMDIATYAEGVYNTESQQASGYNYYPSTLVIVIEPDNMQSDSMPSTLA